MAEDRQQAGREPAAPARRDPDAQRGQPEQPLTPVVLAVLQRYLTDIYRTDPGLSVTDFLITDPALAAVLGSGRMVPDTEESVLLCQDGHGLAVSVYLDEDRKSTRLNSSHVRISYAVFCLKKKK